MKPGNLAVFVPHNGCPHQCSFCDQRRITGQGSQPTPEEVFHTVEQAASGGRDLSGCELAFFGGSFTAIDRETMVSLLKAGKRAVDAFGLKGIRCSTRPDAIDEARLSLLGDYGVIAIELGAQCMDDEVLARNGRGHTCEDVWRASEMIKACGFTLGLQMMTGLPGSNEEIDTATAKAFTEIHPDTVRIYPTLVLPETQLARWYQAGEYAPQSLCKAVELCSNLLLFFEAAGIPVIRLGLHDTPELKARVLAGPYHPAFRQLCESRILLGRILSLLEETGAPKGPEILVAVHPKSISNALGQKRGNLEQLRQKGYRVRFVQDASVPPAHCSLSKKGL